MKTQHATLLSILAACTPGLVQAGPLDPPAGPIAPTYRTLSEVEPRTPINATNTPGDAGNAYVISQPGSYYLTGNLAAPSGKNGIFVNASYVTIDLNGFAVTGSGGNQSGISVVNAAVNVTIRNGSVVFFSLSGIDATGVKGARVQDVNVALVGQSAIRVGQCAILERCTAAQGSNGFSLGPACSVRDCTAEFCTFAGFNASAGCTFSGCTAISGATGFYGLNSCTLENCTATSNTADGFFGDDYNTVRACQSNHNQRGFYLGTRDTEDANHVVDCTASKNAAEGFYLGFRSQVERCTATSNSGNGLDVSSNSIVHACIADGNIGDGFVLGGSTIEECSASLNGQSGTNHAGIHAFFGGNRIINNNVQATDLGIRVELLSGTYIVGNTVSNTNSSANAYSFPVGANNNTYGPILGSGPIAAGTSPLSNWWRF